MLNKFNKMEQTRSIFILKGVIVGLITGFLVSIFRLTIEKMTEYVQNFYIFSQSEPLWLILWGVISVVIALFVGYLIKGQPHITGSGIPQVEGMLEEEVHYRWFPVLWRKFVGGILSVGTGLFLGREGPSIQLGASVGQGLSNMYHSPKYEQKILISSGASAGLAAAFNAPIAAVLFIVEEIHHTFSPLIWLTSLVSAIIANFISLYIFGLQPVLYLGHMQDLPLKYYGLLMILGIILGVLGRLYQKNLLDLPKWFNKLPIPAAFYGIVPLVLVIPIGFYLPQLLGGGNQIILSLEENHFPLLLLLFLFLLRYIFSMISYGSNLPGGIFLPILSLGAILGALFGEFSISYLGVEEYYLKNFIIISMAGYFTAIGKAPLTAIILVTEMVGSINHLMPLGFVSLIAYIVVDLLGGHPIYESLLDRLVSHKKIANTNEKTTIEYPVTAESVLDGYAVRDFSWPKDTLLVAIRREQEDIIPHGDTILQMGDMLIILTDSQHAALVKKELRQKTLIK
ncbi:ClC family H(+)/Cl(-) exchange transporter [Tetragenococcus halophilus]|uniref:ClC family H(+)/Cl(-) exchange transporter n=1 Tax=Tetragenococcus halophilus TaxID=51669 RepID=UPI00209B6B1D|nr:ClC family H(+)/Cl(-) exchange transporter [Tetragenococcus halophilus]MCO8287897.1 ClC family H(+)/Cl(-) exchange transporter [Tetragenococcus halophilus]MCT8309755.1 ClC family H(+)/Cl(-) exchange transporter [Tetragenococcus halophilus]MDN6112447.1 ClC family H(+)/Cl(-) exchange transporter [Tetragenococcus halophilus]